MFLLKTLPKEFWWSYNRKSIACRLLVNGMDDGEYEVYYWRDGNDETDFVLVWGEEVLGLEVKSGRRTLGVGLASFKTHFPNAKTLVIGTVGLSLELFFSTKPEMLF